MRGLRSLAIILGEHSPGMPSETTLLARRLRSSLLPFLALTHIVFRFAIYNTLNAYLPLPNTLLQQLGRQAVIGFVASIFSDTVSNSLRVVKTYRQVHEERVSYCELYIPCGLKLVVLALRKMSPPYHQLDAFRGCSWMLLAKSMPRPRFGPVPLRRSLA